MNQLIHTNGEIDSYYLMRDWANMPRVKSDSLLFGASIFHDNLGFGSAESPASAFLQEHPRVTKSDESRYDVADSEKANFYRRIAAVQEKNGA